MQAVRFLITFIIVFALFPLTGRDGLVVGQMSQVPQVRVTTELVRVLALVIDEEDGRLYTNLKRENFTIVEDAIQQTITGFDSENAALTMVLLLEYNQLIRYIRGEVIRPAGIFVSQFMQPKDYAAIVTFDIRPSVLADFTRNGPVLATTADPVQLSRILEEGRHAIQCRIQSLRK
ncbi:MAG: hypothetical protein MOB07_21845 [Acidobacteria bacterium]|nr:hypothetical protein [Acidobacteriota bacterium]